MILADNIALVTGAGQGIGKASALMLAREGADVAVVDMNGQASEETTREVMALGRRGLSLQADVGDLGDIDRMVQQTIDTFGRIDVLVNNAGAANTALSQASLEVRAQQEGTAVADIQRRRAEGIPLPRANEPDDVVPKLHLIKG